MQHYINILSISIIIYFIILNLSYFILFVMSYIGISEYQKKSKLNNYLKIYQSKLTPPISLIVPAYNEETTIVKNIYSFLSQFDYPEYEVIVVNDGSKDNTLNKILSEFKCEIYEFPYRKVIDTKKIKYLYRSKKFENLIIIDKENGGKADALNAGINVSRYPYFGSIDADTLLEKDSYLKVMIPIIDNPNNVIATGGIVGVLNGCTVYNNKIMEIDLPKNVLSRFQVIEYLRAFLFGRYAWTRLNALPLISGAFGLFKKEAVLNINGYSTEITNKLTVGEDIDLIIRLHKYYLKNKIEYKIIFVPDPMSWTQVPEDLKTLKNQRARWHKGLMETLIQNKEAIFNYDYKVVGMLSLPYYLIFELLSPVIELLGYVIFPYFFYKKWISLDIFILFLIVSFLLGTITSLLAVFLEVKTFNRYKKIKDILLIFLYAFLENFGYRQMTLFFRLIGFKDFFLRKKHWGEMKRKEF
ncbi:MAG: glycosyltransferase [Fusobacteriaceae bacterium]|nr:glycosyltransferase [Fusobacteriaceae bacterium]